tara:strand:- start:214 stop:429 length:216 start_codon:yes stop_codon:yes gene_type:complete
LTLLSFSYLEKSLHAKNQELKIHIKELDFTIMQMKKELEERAKSKALYLQQIKELKKEKLEQNLKKLVEDF